MRHETFVDHYEPINVLVPSKQKAYLTDYKLRSGRDITFVIRQLVQRVMDGEIKIKEVGPRPQKISGYQRK